MQDLYQLVLERNYRETIPFVAVHEANATLLNQIDALQAKCDELERDLLVQRGIGNDAHGVGGGSSALEGRGGTMTRSSTLKNETRLHEKLEKLQEELNQKLKLHCEDQASALELAKDLASNKDIIKGHEETIKKLNDERDRKDRAMEHLTNELTDAKSRTKLAEQQYVGLKNTIRVLQEENDSIKKENRLLETRLVSDKENMVGEMNKLSEMCERLKKEVDMLRSLKSEEEKRTSWFGLSSTTSTKASIPIPEKSPPENSNSRKFDPKISVVVPTKPRQKITAHTSEASCVRYDGTGADLVATGSADSTVKVWDTATGALRATLRGGSSNAILSCDISNGVLVGGGSDKTCRVWNLRTQRMVHHLVGHAHKITCVRLFDNEKKVITGSADRSLLVWDISRQTYRQTATLRHSSTANGVDIGMDSSIAVTGHLDGGIRFWDVRTGDRTADISGLHEGAVTSVQFHPTDTSKVLTNGMDSCIKLVDVRTASPIQTFRDELFQTSYAWSSAAFSPDGAYVASGSSSNGVILVWEASTGKTKARLEGHETGVCGFAWGRGGTSGQQVASVDKKGTLILWA